MDCVIRQWKIKDKKDLAKMLNNKKILDNLRDGLPYPYTEQDAEEFITAMLSADPTSTFAFAITVDGTVVGSIGVFRQDNIHGRTAEMGYYIGEPYWGKGIGSSAVKQVCEYVFTHTDIIRIFAEPFAYNTASCRVLEKAGFQFEGTLRKNALKNGKVLDMKLYSLIKEEFQQENPIVVQEPDCIFCKIANHQLQSNIVYEDDKVIGFLDINPINEGHTLIIPKEHYQDIDEMPEELLTHIMKISKKITKVVKDLYAPDGYSIMQNGGMFNDIGHYHLHVFPRYQQDGFGWTEGETEYESSEEIARRIRQALKNE